MSEQKPAIGANVHYQAYGTPGGEYPPACRAATITEVRDGPLHEAEDMPQPVGLAVFNPTGLFFNRDVPEDQDERAGGTWHWPDACADQEE